MASEEVKQLLDKVSDIRKEVSGLRTELNSLNENKENLYSEKDKVSQKIISMINEIKDLKKERDTYTNDVKQLKVDRERLNATLKTDSEDLKKYVTAKDSIKSKSKLTENPTKIKKEIESLEFKIETEGMSFDKEKKVMLQINDLKKKLVGSAEYIEASDKVFEIRKRIRNDRRDANKIHKDVQEKAKLSQERHEKILELSNSIDELKKDEQEKFNKFVAAKEEFNKVNDVLKEKIKILNDYHEELKKHKVKVKKENKEKIEKTLEEKSKAVDEKIKKGKKLTTEDLLIFQRMGDNDDFEEESSKEEKPKPKKGKKTAKKEDKETKEIIVAETHEVTEVKKESTELTEVPKTEDAPEDKE